MRLIKFLSYPVYYNPESSRATAFVRDHFFNIRSNTRSRSLLKRTIRPLLPVARRISGKEFNKDPGFHQVEPYLDKGEVEVVVAARRFYRLIDFNQGTVTSIFNGQGAKLYYDNEIKVRTDLAGLDFIPKLLHVDDDKKIFIEEYICVSPFKSGNLSGMDAASFLSDVKDALSQVQSAFPVRTVDIKEYAGELTHKILARGDLAGDDRDYIFKLREQALSLEKVDLVFSHSDFRKDQIFFTAEGRMIFIDWECAGYFSRFFDMMELYITEEWLYKNKSISLNKLLDLDPVDLRGAASLFLLELCYFPVKFRRNRPTPGVVKAIIGVDRRLMKYALRGCDNMVL